MKRSMKVGLLCLFVIAPAGAAVWYAARPTPVDVIRPQRKDVTISVTCEGKVRNERGSGVRSTLVGSTVRRVLVKEGDAVRDNQPVVELDDAHARAEVRRCRAAVQQTTAALAKAEADERGPIGATRREAWRKSETETIVREGKWAREAIPKDEATLARRKRLLDEARKTGTPDEVRQAEWYVEQAERTLRDSKARLAWSQTAKPRPYFARQLEEAKGAAKAARVALKAAEERLAQSTVLARFHGTVTDVAVKPGDAVQRDQPLVWVATYTQVVARSPDRFRGDSPLSRDELHDFVWPAYARNKYGPGVAAVPGADAVISVPGRTGKGVRADVTALTRDDKTGEQGILLHANVALPSLRPGAPVNVDIITARYKDVLTLPRTAVLDPMGDAAVLVVREGRVARRPVKLDGRESLEVVVTQGLTGGEAVVRYPTEVKAGVRARPVSGREM